MKKNLLLLFIVFASVQALWADPSPWPGAWFAGRDWKNAENLTANGALTLVNGAIAIKSGDNVIYIMGLNRFIGFIDGLKEGARAAVNGPAVKSRFNENDKIMLAVKLTLNGKDYEISPPFDYSSGKPQFFPDGGGPKHKDRMKGSRR